MHGTVQLHKKFSQFGVKKKKNLNHASVFANNNSLKGDDTTVAVYTAQNDKRLFIKNKPTNKADISLIRSTRSGTTQQFTLEL